MESPPVFEPMKNMRGMDLHFEVIRGKEAIYSELVHSQSLGHQVAICYRMEDKLIVKICMITGIAQGIGGMVIRFRSQPDEMKTEMLIALDAIESIYPIHAFQK